jgi:cystathionine beta-synthase
VIVEATSGNTGMVLAMVAAIRGYRCIFTMPDKMSQEKVKLLRAFGAEVVIVPTAVPPDHPEHYTVKAATIARETPGAILANQFYNPANPHAHYETTGPEIWNQTEGRVTHFLAGSGMGGGDFRCGAVPEGDEPGSPDRGCGPRRIDFEDLLRCGRADQG